jgi:DnaJ-class molecular chaperone
MGFDLFGAAPTSTPGEYFRNNIWWWRPLAAYVVEQCGVAGDGWFDNGGHEVSAQQARRIADTLTALLKNGRVKTYAAQYEKDLAALPDEECTICHGTGLRNDDIIQGTCNGCSGKGTRPAWATHYPFSEENVRDFAAFCRDSGGFSIC